MFAPTPTTIHVFLFSVPGKSLGVYAGNTGVPLLCGMETDAPNHTVRENESRHGCLHKTRNGWLLGQSER